MLEKNDWAGAVDTLDEVEVMAEEDGETASTEKRESCVRLESPEETTGVKMHVDVVPVFNERGVRKIALRSKDKWRKSDPVEVLEWFQNLKDQNQFLPAQVLILKRMRDVAGITHELPSIVIVSLIAQYYTDNGSYADDLLNLFSSISNHFKVTYDHCSILMPANGEELINKINPQDYVQLSRFFNEGFDTLQMALENEDTSELQRVMSNDFPSVILRNEVKSLRSNGWRLALNGSLQKLPLDEEKKTGVLSRNKIRYRYYTVKGEKLAFTLGYKRALGGSQIVRWQVLNAPGSDEIRGGLEQAKIQNFHGNRVPSTNPLYNEEIEQYEGEHWIRAFIIDTASHEVIQFGEKFIVTVNTSAQL